MYVKYLIINVLKGLALDKPFIKMLENQLFIFIRIVTVLKWLLFLGGIIGTIVALVLRHKKKIVKFVGQVSPAGDGQRQQTNGHALNQQKLVISTIQAATQNVR